MQDLNNMIPVGSGWVLGEATAFNDAGQSRAMAPCMARTTCCYLRLCDDFRRRKNSIAPRSLSLSAMVRSTSSLERADRESARLAVGLIDWLNGLWRED